MNNKKGPNKKIDKSSYYELILETHNKKEVAKVKVDKTDYKKVEKARWCLRSKKYRYAVSQIAGKITQMHRVILGIEESNKFIVVDHRDMDGLNNRKKNLRVVSRSINAHNSKKAKGYWIDKRSSIFTAEIMINGKKIRVNGIKTEKDAQKIRKQLRKKYANTIGYR